MLCLTRQGHNPSRGRDQRFKSSLRNQLAQKEDGNAGKSILDLCTTQPHGSILRRPDRGRGLLFETAQLRSLEVDKGTRTVGIGMGVRVDVLGGCLET